MEFIEAYEQHVWGIYGFLAYRTRSPVEAEDLTQETFERALKAWPRFDPARNDARPWLLVIARNVYVDSRRRQAARPRVAPEVEVGAGPESAGSIDANLGPDPEVSAALARLKRREREAIALRFGADLPVAGVAEVLDISVANAQQILSRSLRRLRTLLEHSAVNY
ncbi:MAG TPA: sigma-70 family RNA polymerase sigma factor [Thermoleophilia bacterium]|nr:sigma-70 family RNA polymerase sigma factor [Thermoleophilia bacterium]